MSAYLAGHPQMQGILAVAQAMKDGGLSTTAIDLTISRLVVAKIRSMVQGAEATCAHLLPTTPFDGRKGDPRHN